MPFSYRDDIATADVAFDARGATLAELFRSCADALLRTMVEEPEGVACGQEVAITLEHEELDLLLYAFLEELIFQKDARRLLLHAHRVAITRQDGMYRLEAVAKGEVIAPGRHHLLVDVKAVTLHRFAVVHDQGLWRATVVLDV